MDDGGNTTERTGTTATTATPVATTRRGRRVVLGRLDAHRVPGLRADLLGSRPGAARGPVELDLGPTSFIDMDGIELLAELGRLDLGPRPVVVTDVSQPVRIILELAVACGLVADGIAAWCASGVRPGAPRP